MINIALNSPMFWFIIILAWLVFLICAMLYLGSHTPVKVAYLRKGRSITFHNGMDTPKKVSWTVGKMQKKQTFHAVKTSHPLFWKKGLRCYRLFICGEGYANTLDLTQENPFSFDESSFESASDEAFLKSLGSAVRIKRWDVFVYILLGCLIGVAVVTYLFAFKVIKFY